MRNRFGSDTVAVINDVNGNYQLSVAYTTAGWTLAPYAFVWKGFPLACYTDGSGHYSLALSVVNSSSTAPTLTYYSLQSTPDFLSLGNPTNSDYEGLTDGGPSSLVGRRVGTGSDTDALVAAPSYVYKGNRYAIAQNQAGDSVFVVSGTGTDTVYAGYTTWRGQPFVCNAEHQLLMTGVTLASIDQTDNIHVGGMPLKVARCGRSWYLLAFDTALT